MIDTRTHAQNMAALASANRIRSYRAELKRNLREGASVVPVLLDPAPEVRAMRVETLLLAIPKYGKSKVRMLLNRHRISLAKTVGGLSDRQRGELVAAFGEPSC